VIQKIRPWPRPGTHAIPILALAGALLMGGCQQKDDPVAVYRTFATAVEKGEYKQAYQLLSAGTRAILEARARKAHAESGGGVKDDPVLLFFSSSSTGARTPPYNKIHLMRMEGDEAVINVSSKQGTRELKLVKEETGWKLDLTDALHE
jgi:hypothetical protein